MVSLGFNQTQVNYKNSFNHDIEFTDLYGINIGAYKTYFKGKTANITTGIEYNLLNHKTKYKFDNNAYITQKEYYTTNHSITIPLLFRLNLGLNKKFSFETGPQLNVINFNHYKGNKLSNLKEHLKPSNYLISEIKENINYFNTSLSLNWQLGVGYKFNWSDYTITARLNYIKSIPNKHINYFANYFKLSFDLSLNNINKNEKPKLLNRKFSHTFYLGHPRGAFHNSEVALSGHYEIGFKKKEKSMQELKVSYVLHKYSKGWFTQVNGNSQTFLLQYGGRYYFNKSTHILRPYINGHLGVELVNYENGKNLFLPAFSGGVHIELDHRFNIGFDIEGFMPNAYFRVGYRFN